MLAAGTGLLYRRSVRRPARRNGRSAFAGCWVVRVWAVVGFCIAAPATLAAEVERPLWELGLGLAGLRLPHYRGSDQSHSWVLPVPYVQYRGEIFKADRDGARALLFDSDRVQLDLSVSASAPTRSVDNGARQGMADLAPTLEFGPKLNLALAHGTHWKLDLRAPLRAALTLEKRPRAIGWIATPNLNLDLELPQSWRLGLQAEAVLASRGFNAYFYDVAPAEATAQRPVYRSQGGAAGSQLTLAMSRRFDAAWLGLFVRHDSLRGARFADSPLVRQTDNLAFGIALSWVLASSSQRVVVTE